MRDVAIVLDSKEFWFKAEIQDSHEALEDAKFGQPLEGAEDVSLGRVTHGDGKDGLPEVHDCVEERVASGGTRLIAESGKELDHSLRSLLIVWFTQHILQSTHVQYYTCTKCPPSALLHFSHNTRVGDGKSWPTPSI